MSAALNIANCLHQWVYQSNLSGSSETFLEVIQDMVNIAWVLILTITWLMWPGSSTHGFNLVICLDSTKRARISPDMASMA